MKKNIFKWNVSAKLLVSFIAILAIPAVSIGLISFNSAQGKIKQQINGSASSSVNLFNQSISNSIGSWESAVQVLTSDLNKSTFQKDLGTNSTPALTALSNFAAGHRDFLHVYVGTDTGIIDIRPYTKMPDGYDPRKRPWYQEAIKNPGKPVVTAPYKDASSNSMVVTITEALPDKHGVVGADVTLGALTKMASRVHIGNDGYLAIFDPTKVAIVDKGVAQGATITDHNLNPMFQSNSGEFSYHSKGIGQDIIFNTNPVTGWKVAGVMFSNEYTQAANPILITMLIVLAIALILGIVLSLFITRSITKRLKLLVELSGKVANGDLSQLLEVHSQDELGQLGHSFNNMINKLRTVIKEVVDSSEQVAASSEELTASSQQVSKATEHIA